MKSNLGRVVLGIAVVVIAVVLLIVLKDEDNGEDHLSAGAPSPAEQAGSQPGGKGEKQSEPSLPTIVVKNGKPVGGIEELTYSEGEQIRFKVDSDISEEIHVHGYDISKEVEAGGSVSFDFPATIEGVFEAELEERGEQILELRVEP